MHGLKAHATGNGTPRPLMRLAATNNFPANELHFQLKLPSQSFSRDFIIGWYFTLWKGERRPARLQAKESQPDR